MSIFSKRRYLYEAEDDDTTSDAGSEDTSTEETPSSNEGEESENSDTEESNEESEETDDESNEDEDQDEDFSIDSDVDDDMSGGEDNSSSSPDTSSSSTSTDSDEDLEDNELKKKDRELFDTLSDAEQKIKIRTLKELFVELYSNTDNFIDKFNSLSIEYDDANEQLNRVISTLYNLKKMISDYLLHKFDTSSYIENDIMFNKYLSMLNSIKNVSDQLKKAYIDDNSAS